MALNPLRRSQLIAPFGPGSLHILEGGIAVVTGGLDDWFKDKNGNPSSDSFILDGPLYIREPRLEKQLGVSHFRLAPGPENRTDSDQPELVTPVYRFPTWFYCSRCHKMTKADLHTHGKLRCRSADCKKQPLQQVRFAAVCDYGHLQDFPWLEWAHRSLNFSPECENSLMFKAQGAGSLADISVECTRCNTKPRSLGGVMSGTLPSKSNSLGSSGLTQMTLSDESEFTCRGHSPWLGVDKMTEICPRPLRAALINGNNLHYGNVKSAIFIPPQYRPSLGDLAAMLEEPELRLLIKRMRQVGLDIPMITMRIRQEDASSPKPRLTTFSDDQIGNCLNGHEEAPPSNGDIDIEGDETPDDLQIRRDEYKAFLGETDREGRLVLRHLDTSALPNNLPSIIDDIVAIDKLRETRVFAGFSRLMPIPPPDAPHPHKSLWRTMPPEFKDRWLPASVVQGEGIFIRFNEDALQTWESTEAVLDHIKTLQDNHDSWANRLSRPTEVIEPRFVLLHTLAHLLINRLVFECGYGSSSLRERLYVTADKENPMSGILIYTAAGDAEGTMGGLVRLADPISLGEIIVNALGEAQWCSSDPICSESASEGQGPDSLNLAACHCCSLLPETSCEKFNTLLDRSLFIEGHPAAFFPSKK